MNQNGKTRKLAAVEVVDESTETTGFYDTNSPLLKPAKEEDKRKTRGWKRRLIGWSLAMLLIAGGVFALYLLLRVNRVNVQVQADSPRNSQTSKPKDESTKAENDLTAEAINIARNASRNDNGVERDPNFSPSPNPSPVPSPHQLNNGANVGSINTPVYERFDENNGGNGNQQQNADKSQPQQKSTELALAVVNQSHANVTQSIFVDESQVRPATLQLPVVPASLKTERMTSSLIAKPAAPYSRRLARCCRSELRV